MSYDISDEHSLSGEHIHIMLVDATAVEKQVSISHNIETGELDIYVYKDELICNEINPHNSEDEIWSRLVASLNIPA